MVLLTNEWSFKDQKKFPNAVLFFNSFGIGSNILEVLSCLFMPVWFCKRNRRALDAALKA